jgi:hypothetical protein
LRLPAGRLLLSRCAAIVEASNGAITEPLTEREQQYRCNDGRLAGAVTVSSDAPAGGRALNSHLPFFLQTIAYH